MEIEIKFFNLKAIICKSLFSKIKGKMLSFSRKPLLFVFPSERKVQIHMLFVFMPLLVIWLDDKKRIVDYRHMLPFVSIGCSKAKYVLEIPLRKKLRKIKRGLKLGFRI